jgi:hypothetical protein
VTCCARRAGFDTLHSQPVEGHRSPTMAYTVRRHRLPSITRAPLPQGDRRARPALAGGAVSGECNRIVLDAGDVFDDAFAVRCPSIDAEGEFPIQLDQVESVEDGVTDKLARMAWAMMARGESYKEPVALAA